MEPKFSPNPLKRIGYNYDDILEDEPLYGDVEQMIVRYYSSESDDDSEEIVPIDIEEISPRVIVYKFNKRGDCESIHKYDCNGNLTGSSHFKYDYDARGNVLSARRYVDGEDYPNWWLNKKYDQCGRCIEECMLSLIDSGTSSLSNLYCNRENHTWKYSSVGVLIEEVNVISDGCFDGDKYRKLKYDSNGKLTEIISNCGFSERAIVLYDDKDQMVEFRELRGNGELFRRQIYTYDEQGNVLSEEDFDASGKMYRRRQYTYNAAGQLIRDEVDKGLDYRNSREIEYTPEGQNICHIEGGLIWKGKYNTQGRCVELVVYNEKSGALTSCYKHTYDSHGNEVSNVEFETEKQLLTYCVKREITYR